MNCNSLPVPPFHETLTSSQATKRLHVSKPKLYQLLRNGALRGFRIGSHWRIDEASIAEFIQRGGFHE